MFQLYCSVLLQMLASEINFGLIDMLQQLISHFYWFSKLTRWKVIKKYCQEVVYFLTSHLLEVNFVFGKILCVIFSRAQQVVKRATPNQQWKTPNNRNYFLWKMREKMRFTIHIRSTQLFLGKSRWKNQRFLILRGSPWKV